jgi:formate/nitrite transporter FocA (FNT family)
VPLEPAETVVAEETLEVRRSPKYVNFMIVGAVAGAVLALLLTVLFPQNAEFDPAQVFGFLLLGGVTVGVALSSVVAIVLDRIVGRSATAVVVDRLDANIPRAFENTDPGSDPQPSNENS